MKKLNKTTQSKAQSFSAAQANLYNTDCGLHIDAKLLIKRINSLVAHVSNLDGADEAEKNSRETSAHIKNIKEIMALNESLKEGQAQEKQSYTLEEEKELAAELAALIFKNGGFS